MSAEIREQLLLWYGSSFHENRMLDTIILLLDEVERLNHEIHGTDDGEPNQIIHAKVAETLGIEC